MIRKTFRLLSLVIILSLLSCQSIDNETHNIKLWYESPAEIWEEALPLGNGSFGAMVFGNPINEVYQMNEETLWSGPADERYNPKAPDALPLIRDAINNGEYREAEQLWRENSQGPYTARYLPMANLFIDMLNMGDEVENFYRDLNISDATATVSYTQNGVNYKRTTFISFPDQVMVVKIESDKRNSISFDASLNSDLRYSTYADNGKLILKGKAPYHVAHRNYDPNQVSYSDEDDGPGLNFEVQMQVIHRGGDILSTDSSLTINNANEAIVILSSATSSDMDSFLKSSADIQTAHRVASQRIANVAQKSYSQLLKSHKEDYKPLFDRVELNLGEGKDNMPMNKRLSEFQNDQADYGLVATYFQFGRYLTIAGSRSGGLPTNLQGIWNRHVQPPWGSNYTTNINTEMNYWPVEVTGLGECAEPLLSFIRPTSR